MGYMNRDGFVCEVLKGLGMRFPEPTRLQERRLSKLKIDKRRGSDGTEERHGKHPTSSYESAQESGPQKDINVRQWVGLDLQAQMAGADMKGAVLTGTVMADLNLDGVKNLEDVDHWGPSSIGIDTIYRSGGKIPESFLRGAGVPASFIAYMHPLTAVAFEFCSCFISYSTLDQKFAERLHADLQAKGVRCWFAPHDIQGGRKLHEQIDDAIKLYNKLLLILSDASMSSEWESTEISKWASPEYRTHAPKLPPESAPVTRSVAGQSVRRCYEGASVRWIKGAVAAVWSDDEIGLGPRTMERPRAFHGADNVVTALNNYSGEVADARDVTQELVFGFEEALIEEVVDLNAREGQGEFILLVVASESRVR